MALLWVRMDTSLPFNDKILAVENDKEFSALARSEAVRLYVFAILWCGQQETDGQIPATSLQVIRGSTRVADVLVKHGLWEAAPDGYQIHNYGNRQQLRSTTQAKTEASLKANCARWHGNKCWKDDKCSKVVTA
jgi:hypothetical protein